jgi:hypothetical protein
MTIRGFTCADCGNAFLQPPRCVTCGAQKLYDSTLRTAERRAEAAEQREEKMRDALADACNLLEGWITKYCAPRHRVEHRADLARKRRILEGKS